MNWPETILLAVLAALGVWHVITLGRLDRAQRAANGAAGVEVMLAAEIRLLERKHHDAIRELESLRSVLREEGTPSPEPDALGLLEELARRGYGPTFTQGGIHTSSAVVTFGPKPGDFADAIRRLWAMRGTGR